jgi:hypothetical protein
MKMSSRGGDGFGHLGCEFPAVTQECPEHVDKATGES